MLSGTAASNCGGNLWPARTFGGALVVEPCANVISCCILLPAPCELKPYPPFRQTPTALDARTWPTTNFRPTRTKWHSMLAALSKSLTLYTYLSNFKSQALDPKPLNLKPLRPKPPNHPKTPKFRSLRPKPCLDPPTTLYYTPNTHY